MANAITRTYFPAKPNSLIFTEVDIEALLRAHHRAEEESGRGRSAQHPDFACDARTRGLETGAEKSLAVPALEIDRPLSAHGDLVSA